MAETTSQPDFGKRLIDGDEHVLEAILRTHGPPVRSLLRRKFLGPLSDTDFEDILAIALFRMWQHRTRYDASRATLRVWFFRIAENVTRDVLRHGWQKARQLEVAFEPLVLSAIVDHRSPPRSKTDKHSEQTSGGPPSKTSGHESDLMGKALAEVLAQLPDKQRQILMADAQSTDGKVSSQDLASELGIPASTVRVYRRRALERIRTEMGHRGWDHES